MTDPRPYCHHFPMTIIQHAVQLDHRFPLSYRDGQEVLHLWSVGMVYSHEDNSLLLRTDRVAVLGSEV